jgi:hypothetical protein
MIEVPVSTPGSLLTPDEDGGGHWAAAIAAEAASMPRSFAKSKAGGRLIVVSLS